MVKQHVKVYAIMAMAEIDIEANNQEEARNKVAELLKNKHPQDIDGLKFKKPDRDHLIVTMDE